MAMFLAQSRMHESDDTDIEIVAVIDYSSLRILNRRRRAVEHFSKSFFEIRYSSTFESD